ncbi:MAG: DMT family transporter [Chlorobi bacterium]|nr:DMT family transporter [Chlorobiota bacterium]
MRVNKLIVYPVVILSMILWSFSFIWYKEVFVYYKPITVIFFRLLISAVFLLILNRILNKQQIIHRADYKTFALLSFLQPFLYFLCESYGMNYVSSTIGAVIISTIPLFTPFIASYMFKEKLSFLNILGMIVSFMGILLIIFKKNMELTASPKGVLLMFLAVFAAVGYSAIVLKLTAKYNSFTIIATQNTIGIFLFLPLFFIFDYQQFITVQFSWHAIKYLVYLAVFASSLAFILFTFSIKILGLTKANMFTNVIPIFTAIFAYFLLKEEITVQKTLGIIVVVAGLFLSQFNYLTFKKRRKFFFKKIY